MPVDDANHEIYFPNSKEVYFSLGCKKGSMIVCEQGGEGREVQIGRMARLTGSDEL